MSILSSSTAPFSCLARSLAYLQTISFCLFCLLFFIFCWMSASSVFIFSALSVCLSLLLHALSLSASYAYDLLCLHFILFFLCVCQFCVPSDCTVMSVCISLLLHSHCCNAPSASPVCIFISCSVLSSPLSALSGRLSLHLHALH